ncbi:prolipoprotein diacylglyceryl transferase [Sporosarcina thermotolerans]|uniref:Phosphatidylglycerol--prolipoprotein diacylglyceryl transferase n=1 Tax=Sporosarcina thermotolerans TaxID=633404 RepID=A0AAW9AB41_9BACL|nr:prolipoprotein diacylglyceryl transferase [Sporosarcina thermotolerans]MDW0118402.1 prolipoprotein diacylglyceryl transferase [Sporosarcina thermotolerans]WHT49452.1 prolipoprotein diacylglyceryl transferase [Sporosarcina thermotolerans]
MFDFLTINPTAFEIGPISVRWYGILITTGIILAFLVVQKEMVKRGMHPDFLTDLLIWAVPISIISARIYYVIFSWDSYRDNPADIFKIWEGGIAIHGALIGAFLTTYFFTKKRGISFWKVVDIAVPGILIGQIIGRWGNFINQEAHGGPVSEQFLENTWIPNWIMNQMTIEGVTYHPTFLYESLWNVVGLIIVLILRRVRLKRGEIFFFYLIWYSIGRYFIEGMRTDSLYGGDLRAAQIVSILAILFGASMFVYRRFIKKVKVNYLDK